MKHLLFITLLLSSLCSFGQQEMGLPPIRNYLPQEYGSHRQNWAITQAPDGTMYFGNGKGVLIYDGEYWRLLILPNRGHVRSLDTGPDSLIYIGGNNEFGVVRRNAIGVPEYESWLSKIEPGDRGFGRVRATIAREGEVYFQAYHRLFRWRGEQLKVWRFKPVVHRVFEVGDQIFACNLDLGLMQLNEQDEFELAPGGHQLKGERIYAMLPFKGKILLSTRSRKLLLYDRGHIEPFRTEADALIERDYLDAATFLPNNQLAFAGTRSGGILIIDGNGKLITTFDAQSGLSTSSVLHVFADRDGALWAGLQEGLARIEIHSPFAIYDEGHGLAGSVQSITRHNGELYAGTSSGVAKLMNGPGPLRFENQSSVTSYVWDLQSWKDRLLVGKTHGLYEYHNQKKAKIFDYDNIVSGLTISKYDSSSLFFVMDDGMAQIRHQGGRWEEQGRFNGIPGAIKDLVETAPGVFWLKSRSSGLFRITFPVSEPFQLDFSQGSINHFGPEQGLPVGEPNIYQIGGALYVRSEDDELYQFDLQDSVFKQATDFKTLFSIEAGQVLPKNHETKNAPLWLDWYIGDEKMLLKAEKDLTGRFQVKKYPLSRKIDLYKDIYSNEVFYGDNESVWYSGMDGIIQYRLNREKNQKSPFSAYIANIYSSDSLIRHHQLKSVEKLMIPFRSNDLVFEFSSPLYQEEDLRLYQYRLVGFDDDWSNWSEGVRKEYTNLREGNYVFELKAKDGFGAVSNPASFAFVIQPPWYRTLWAYFLYVLGGVTLVLGLIFWRSRALRIENARLEKLVAKRTKLIREQADELKELNQVKSRFFANISHELRTPLTLILGPIEDLLNNQQSGVIGKRLQMIHNNAKRLLKLINQLLDLSKIEDGKLELKAAQYDLIPFCRGLVMSFESFAEQRGIDLKFQAPSEEVFLYFDRDKLERILINLLSNALKFTPEGGLVVTKISKKEERAVIEVKDTGIGIHPDQLPHIFDRFYQADNSDTRAFEGTGIGLALTKDLVELHSGTIQVDSRKGKGSTFTVHFPFGKEHLKDEQIVVAQQNLTAQPDLSLEPELKISPTSVDTEDVQGKLVLVVDDNREMREYIGMHLSSEFKILEAKDGEDGWQLALEKLPDLIISDVMMPRVSGYDLCKKLKADLRTTHIPVILLTAKAGIDEKLKGLSLHADDYLVKPFNANELGLRVSNLIASRLQLQKRFADKVVFQPKEVAVTPQEEVFLNNIIETIEKYIDDSQFGVDQFGRELGLSRSQLNRKMQALVNRSPNQFIRSYRLEKAKQLIEKNAGTIAEISYDVGFSSPSYFSKCFQEEFGFTPKEFKGGSKS